MQAGTAIYEQELPSNSPLKWFYTACGRQNTQLWPTRLLTSMMTLKSCFLSLSLEAKYLILPNPFIYTYSQTISKAPLWVVISPPVSERSKLPTWWSVFCLVRTQGAGASHLQMPNFWSWDNPTPHLSLPKDLCMASWAALNCCCAPAWPSETKCSH